MKRPLYFLLLLFVLSCAKNKSETPARDILEMEAEEAVSEAKPILGNTSETFEYQHLTTQKLQDYFDLLLLQQQHPEFKKSITIQLQKLLKDSIALSHPVQEITIQNVQQIGNIQHVSDSIQKMKVHFDMIADNDTKSDSIVVFIKTKKIVLDGNTVIAAKLMFSKE